MPQAATLTPTIRSEGELWWGSPYLPKVLAEPVQDLLTGLHYDAHRRFRISAERQPHAQQRHDRERLQAACRRRGHRPALTSARSHRCLHRTPLGRGRRSPTPQDRPAAPHNHRRRSAHEVNGLEPTTPYLQSWTMEKLEVLPRPARVGECRLPAAPTGQGDTGRTAGHRAALSGLILDTSVMHPGSTTRFSWDKFMHFAERNSMLLGRMWASVRRRVRSWFGKDGDKGPPIRNKTRYGGSR